MLWCINDYYVLKEIGNKLFLFVLGVSEINIQVPQDNRDAARWAGFPSCSEVFHPHRFSGGGINAHALKLLVASNELECEEVQWNNTQAIHS